MEEEIKELLGESYQEGMSAKDVQEAFNKMLLESGKYVNKDNASAQQRKLEKELNKNTEKESQTVSAVNKNTDIINSSNSSTSKELGTNFVNNQNKISAKESENNKRQKGNV